MIQNKIQIAIPRARLSFPHLFEKEPLNKYNNLEEARSYVATFILSKDNEKHIEVVKNIREAEKKLLKDIGVKTNPHNLLICGDNEYDAIDDSTEKGKLNKSKKEYLKNSWLFKAKSKFPVQLQLRGDKVLDIEVDKNPFYAGCYVNVIITMTTYSKGISKYLQLVQFAKDGERLSGGGALKASDHFEDEDEDSATAVDDFNDVDLF